MASALAVGGVPILTVGAAPGPPTSPSSNPYDYALFATQSLSLQGGGKYSHVDGNIGAGSPDTWLPWAPEVSDSGASTANGNPRLALCRGTGGAISLGAQNYVASPSTYFGPSACGISEAFTFETDTSPPSAMLVPRRSAWTPPSVVLPSLPTVVPGVAGPEFVWQACWRPDSAITQATSALAPNMTYGNVTFQNTMYMPAGTYTFCSITVPNMQAVLFGPGVTVNVVGNINVPDSSLGAFPTTMFYVGGTQINFGRESYIAGTFDAPNASVSLGHNTHITGHVWAKTMHSDVGFQMTGGPPPPPPTTVVPTTATTVAPTTIAPPTTAPPTTSTTPPTIPF